MKKLLIALAGVLVLLAVLRSAGDLAYWHRYRVALHGSGAQVVAQSVSPRLQLPGAGGDLPKATAEAESIAAEALTLASEAAVKQGDRALLVHRHGHRVHAYFADGVAGNALIDGGELAPALLALATGALVDGRRMEFSAAVDEIRTVMRANDAVGWRNPWSTAARARFSLAPPPAFLQQDVEGSLTNTISLRVWQPLGAGDAWLWGRDDSALRLDCCVVARLDDWMRVGDLFLQQGTWQGARIVSPDWMRHLLAADAEGVRHPIWLREQQPWTGDEPPATRDAYWFDLGSDVRLWIFPRRGLTVLRWGREPGDTTIPNIILRGLTDQAPGISGGDSLNDMVPGH
jgi:hypothetical protein